MTPRPAQRTWSGSRRKTMHKMKNPLRKRLLRDLRQDLGKYLVIFLFMTMFIALMSGYLVAAKSMIYTTDQSYEEFNIEYGHIAFDKEPDAAFLDTIEYKGDVKLYDLRYKELTYDTATVRVYTCRDQVNIETIMEGQAPQNFRRNCTG